MRLYVLLKNFALESGMEKVSVEDYLFSSLEPEISANVRHNVSVLDVNLSHGTFLNKHVH